MYKDLFVVRREHFIRVYKDGVFWEFDVSDKEKELTDEQLWNIGMATLVLQS